MSHSTLVALPNLTTEVIYPKSASDHRKKPTTAEASTATATPTPSSTPPSLAAAESASAPAVDDETAPPVYPTGAVVVGVQSAAMPSMGCAYACAGVVVAVHSVVMESAVELYTVTVSTAPSAKLL